jgi:hypothetical protein
VGIKDIFVKFKTLKASTDTQRVTASKNTPKKVKIKLPKVELKAKIPDVKIKIKQPGVYSKKPSLALRFIDTTFLSELLSSSLYTADDILPEDLLFIGDNFQLQATFFREFDELANLEENFIVDFSKVFADMALPSDSFALHPYKGVIDQSTILDVTMFNFGKNSIEVLQSVEVVSKDISNVKEPETVSSLEEIIVHFVKNLSDLIITTDTALLSAEGQSVMNMSLYTSLSDELSFNLSAVREFIEQSNITDVAQKALSKQLSDSISVLDSILFSSGDTQSEIDNTTITEFLNWAVSKRLVDEAYTTEAFSKDIHKAVIDTLSVTDILNLYPGVNEEQLDISEVVDNISVYIMKQLVDGFVLSEVVSKQVSKVFQDTLSVTDIASLYPGLSEEQADISLIADAVALYVTKQIIDGLVLSEIISKDFSKTFEDTLSVSDVLSSYLGASEQQLDISEVNDSISIITLKHLSDNLVLAETVSKDLSKILEDTAFTSDLLTLYPGLSDEKLDTSQAIDIASAYVIKQVIDETSTLDILTKSVQKNLLEAVDIYDISSQGLGDTKSEIEITEPEDILSKYFSKVLNDTSALQDVLSIAFSKPAIDSSLASDSINLNPNKVTHELLSTDDLFAVYAEKVVNELATTSEAINVSLNKVLTEEATISDLLALTVFKTIADTLNVTDTFSASAGQSQRETDTFNTFDQLINIINKVAQDESTISDVFIKDIYKRLEDIALVTDELLYAQGIGREEDQTEVSVTADFVAYAINKMKEDALSLSDVSSITFYKSLADIAGVYDNIIITGAGQQNESTPVYAEEVFNLVISKVLADIASNSDIFILYFNKLLGDQFLTTTDEIDLSIGKNFVELKEVIEELSFSVSQELLEGFSYDDILALHVNKTLEDVLSHDDVFNKNISKFETDVTTIYEAVVKTLLKSLNDNLVITDALSFVISKVFSDQCSVDDLLVLSLNKALLESVVIDLLMTKAIEKSLVDVASTYDDLNYEMAGNKERSQTSFLDLSDEISFVSSIVRVFEDVLNTDDELRMLFNKVIDSVFITEDWAQVANTSFTTEVIYDIAYDGNNTWVAVGGFNNSNGRIATASNPAGPWTQVADSSFGTSHINKVAYGNGLWVASGNNGKIAVSSDPSGVWTQVSNPLSSYGYLSSVAYGNGLWVVGSYSAYATATDPYGTWTLHTAAINIEDIVYADSLWVMAGHGRVGVSSNPAVSLSINLLGFTTSILNRIAYGDGVWAAVGWDSTLITATDPAGTWTAQNTEFFPTTNFHVIDYINNVWLIAGNSGRLATASDPRNTWTVENSSFGSGSIYSSSSDNNGVFLLGGEAGKMAIKTVNIVNEGIQSSDQISKNILKESGEISNINAILSFVLSKVFSDNVILSNIFSVLINKSLSEIAAISDNINKSYDKQELDIINTSANITTVSVNKQVNEFINNQSIRSVYIEKDFVDTLTISDFFEGYLPQGDQVFDSFANVSDSGLINVQNYVDAGYFSEDYVGNNYTF